jgi:hypothetical protein
MITLKIKYLGSKKYETIKIPTCRELTVNQYIKVKKSIKDGGLNLIDYLCCVLDKEYRQIYQSGIKRADIILESLGMIEDYSKLKTPRSINLLGVNYNLDDIKIESHGQRFTIEETARKYQDEELLCFILSVAIINEPDIDLINQMKEKIMEASYIEILPAAFFLLKNFLNGRSKEQNILKRLAKTMKIQKLRKLRA